MAVGLRARRLRSPAEGLSAEIWKAALDDLRRDGGHAGAPVRIELDGGRLARSGATLTRTLKKPLPAGTTAVLASYDVKRHAWRAVPTTLRSDRRTLTARVQHFSIWDDIEYGAGWLLDRRVDAPKCEEPVPKWVSDTTFLDDKNAPLRWCVGHDPKNDSVLVVKVAVNRSYGVGVHPAITPSWTYDSLFGSGPDDFLTGLLTRGASIPERVRGVFGGQLPLLGAEEADFGFTEAQVRKAGTNALISVTLDGRDGLAGLTYMALSKLAGDEGKVGRQVAAITAIVAIAQCENALLGPLSKHAWSQLAKGAVSCATDHADDVTKLIAATLPAALPKTDAKQIGRLAGKIGGKLWQVWAAGVAFQFGTWLADRKLDHAAFELHAFARVIRNPTPTAALSATSTCLAWNAASFDARKAYARQAVPLVAGARGYSGEEAVAYVYGYIGGGCKRAADRGAAARTTLGSIVAGASGGAGDADGRSAGSASSANLAVGSEFDDRCVVAWPTAPVRTSHEIELTMSCLHVPESKYLLTHVTYGDPDLAITPSTGRIRVHGRVTDVASSGYGFKELVVDADRIDLP